MKTLTWKNSRKILSCQSQSTFSQACPETRHSHIIYNILTCTSVKPHKIARKTERKHLSHEETMTTAHTQCSTHFYFALTFLTTFHSFISFAAFLAVQVVSSWRFTRDTSRVTLFESFSGLKSSGTGRAKTLRTN